MDMIPISVEGYEKLKRELEDLKSQRPAIIKAIAEARAEGDLRENAGYDAARERQGMVEAKIRHIESHMAVFTIIDLMTMHGPKVAFGATVEVEDLENGEQKHFTLLGPDEADFSKGSISVLAPVGRALLGKEEGDVIEVNAPRGKIEYEILAVRYPSDEA